MPTAVLQNNLKFLFLYNHCPNNKQHIKRKRFIQLGADFLNTRTYIQAIIQNNII